ncbi:hypothetical protein G647_01517 [Cladophialophora carrionii CBS 160.54]|uniref:Uncharacterized protein n=1 Tax=Cladophialophora carrionii CBS 160.54 TaxID=1279043 RepID=V9DQ72_9EURO|nr:uncharacterized protein G647_01517 [Cladophialophora carrionii CBS 160.54]ETI29064.1 hypothetical protein G647_01517 [Cladophialophora carrionii CBS 160.54]
MAQLTHSLVAIRRPTGLKRHRWMAGVGCTSGIRHHCSCGKSHSPARHFDLCLLFPRHRFGSSRFNTVFLLLFRLFYHASSFEVASIGHASKLYLPAPVPLLQESIIKAGASEGVSSEGVMVGSANRGLPGIFKNFKRFSTREWLATMLENPDQFKNLKVNSITWIKALASPFSHEFTQFIVEDSVSGQKTRIAAGREENGDWVLVGWDWASGDTPSDHYNLPLPLLSVTFDDPSTKPDLGTLAHVLASTTEKHPAYKFRREMCWWYAETVLEVMHEQFGGKVKEWEWSRYRYSFIVKTSFIRRKVLTKHAELFRRQLAEEMSY